MGVLKLFSQYILSWKGKGQYTRVLVTVVVIVVIIPLHGQQNSQRLSYPYWSLRTIPFSN